MQDMNKHTQEWPAGIMAMVGPDPGQGTWNLAIISPFTGTTVERIVLDVANERAALAAATALITAKGWKHIDRWQAHNLDDGSKVKARSFLNTDVTVTA